MIEFNKKIKYDIYIGLKDKETYSEYLTTNDFKEVVDHYCNENKIAFSLSTLRGGYKHNKGYVTENSLRVELIGADYEEVKKMALWLKERINTDTVMITKEEIDATYA